MTRPLAGAAPAPYPARFRPPPAASPTSTLDAWRRAVVERIRSVPPFADAPDEALAALLYALEGLAPQPAGPALPEAARLRSRYGLSRREAEVALLIAEGLANDEIAARLFISPHTARRHTEQVLDKLGLRSRKALALKLLQDDFEHR